LRALSSYDWPGNVRELRNLIERYFIVSPGKEVGVSHLPAEIRAGKTNSPYAREKAQADEKAAIMQALIRHKGNQSAVSRDLGIPLTTLRRRVKAHGLDRLL
jgi:transcriptional regulator of acetoin/glycerol metabolism